MAEHTFCRAILAEVMKDVTKKVPAEIRKEAWAYNYGDGKCEFQIPSQEFYWYGQACCSWYARYMGWSQFLERHTTPENA